MLCIENPIIYYDSRFDVMYYTIKDTSNSYGDENIDNIVVMKDVNTDEITGYVIMNFYRIYENKTKEYEILSNLIDVDNVIAKCGLY